MFAVYIQASMFSKCFVCALKQIANAEEIHTDTRLNCNFTKLKVNVQVLSVDELGLT